MPGHPCGSIVDYLRFTYKTQMRLVKGQSGIMIKWQKARPESQVMNGPGTIRSRIWESDWRTEADLGQFGEVYGASRKWIVPEVTPPILCAKGPYWPEIYKPGVKSTDAFTYPVLRMDSQGRPIACCGDPLTWPSYGNCDLTVRWPSKIRLRTFKPDLVNYCDAAEGTDLVMARGDDGVWRGTGTFGTTGLAIAVEYPDKSVTINDCWMIMKWTDFPPNFVRWFVVPGTEREFFIVNPPSILIPFVNQNGWQTGFSPCGFLSPLPSWKTGLSVGSWNPD